jgi:hypothetical protein
MHIIASMAFTWSTSLMRRLYQLALLAVCAHGAHAQSLTRGTRLELLGGATFPNFTGDGSTKHRTGFTGGIGLVQPLGTGGWFFEPQVAYAMKGAKFEDIDPHTTIKLDYVDVPILLRYEFWVDADSRPFINLGATPSFKVGCSGAFGILSPGVHARCDDLDPHGFDVALTGGAGWVFQYETHVVTIGGRFDNGMTEVFEHGPTERNKVWSVIATIDFGWGR